MRNLAVAPKERLTLKGLLSYLIHRQMDLDSSYSSSSNVRVCDLYKIIDKPSIEYKNC